MYSHVNHSKNVVFRGGNRIPTFYRNQTFRRAKSTAFFSHFLFSRIRVDVAQCAIREIYVTIRSCRIIINCVFTVNSVCSTSMPLVLLTMPYIDAASFLCLSFCTTSHTILHSLWKILMWFTGQQLELLIN